MNRTGVIISLTIILLIIMSSFGILSINQAVGEGSSTVDEKPFYSDHVVEVRFVIPEQEWEFMQANPIAEQYVKADFWYDGELIPDIAIRPKGNSSLRSAASRGTSRFSLKADLNFFNSARNLYGVKKLNFNNGFSDPTLIRESLAYDLFRQMDIATPRTSFVDLWINDTHLGVYTMVEQVDKTFLSNNFVDNTGNLYKPEMPAAYLNWTEEEVEESQIPAWADIFEDHEEEVDINLGGGKLEEILQALEPIEIDKFGNIVSPIPDIQPNLLGNQQGNLVEQMRLKTNENSPDHSLLFRFLDILNNEPDETFPAEIEKVLDVDEVLRYLAVSALIVHLDNYIAMGHNYYLYDDNGKFVIIPWDLNMAFGTFNYGLDREQLINYYIDEPTGGAFRERPLVYRLLSYQPYLYAYHGYLEELLEGPFAVDTMNSRVDEIAELIRPSVITDTLKFYSTKQWESSLIEDLRRNLSMTSRTGTPQNAIGLKSFVIERNRSVRLQLEGLQKSSSGNGSGNGGRFGIRRN
jgi:hypothetical protein